jgi:biotin synthase-like enzyme
MNELVAQANQVYRERFDGEAWFGRCIFLSFYCERGTCDFCFRSVAKHQEKHAKNARRSLASILAEALLIKAFGWRIEFLTGGYGILDDEELLRTIRLVSQALGQKLWINLGELSTELLEEFQPYVEGIVASIEAINPKLHDKVCPDKPIGPYEEMLEQAGRLGFKKGCTIVLGLGETKEDFALHEAFIRKHGLDRITLYALRPVQGTPYDRGPTTDDEQVHPPKS